MKVIILGAGGRGNVYAKYFSENGFELRNSMTKENVSQAMKKLSRIFHPDKGGTHEEFTELNKNAEILTKFSVN